MRFFRVSRPRFWGDYGSALVSGFAKEGLGSVKLARTGPFVPPISFPGSLLIVSEGLIKNASGFFEAPIYDLRPVEYSHIVEIAWETWSRSNEPLFFPESGEPEDYIFRGQHSEKCMNRMDRCLELVLPRNCTSHSKFNRSNGWEFSLNTDGWEGEQLFRAKNQNYIFASEAGAQFLKDHVNEWINLDLVI